MVRSNGGAPVAFRSWWDINTGEGGNLVLTSPYIPMPTGVPGQTNPAGWVSMILKLFFLMAEPAFFG